MASDAEYVSAPAPVVEGTWREALVAVVVVVVVLWDGPVAGMQAGTWPRHSYPLVKTNWESLEPFQEWRLQGRPDTALQQNLEWRTLGDNEQQVPQKVQRFALVLSPGGLALFLEYNVVVVEQKLVHY